ncbi:SHOCT domain-containing protein [Enterococcus thailandicus]|uniref:SHOCT domain-containing protein n=1 Tax=Enterococcus thailandicus TaxID=417368 RepID=UPI003BC76DA9
MAKSCVICTDKIGALTGKIKLSDGNYVCKKCFSHAGFTSSVADIQTVQSLSTEQIKTKFSSNSSNLSAKDIQKKKSEYFKKNSDIIIGDIIFNDKDKALLIKKSMLMNRAQDIVKYDEIQTFTPIFLGGKIKKHHGITRALVGGVLVGPIGALIGAGTGGKEWESINRLGIEIYLKDNRVIKYDLINNETKINSLAGKNSFDQYNHLSAKLESILSNQTNSSVEATSEADEIRKYKELLDDGIISQEEFNTKKKELLNL